MSVGSHAAVFLSGVTLIPIIAMGEHACASSEETATQPRPDPSTFRERADAEPHPCGEMPGWDCCAPSGEESLPSCRCGWTCRDGEHTVEQSQCIAEDGGSG